MKNVYINREPKGVFPFLACNIYDMRLDIEKPFFDSYKKHWLSCINILEYYYNMLIEEPQHFIPVCEVSSQEVFTTNIMELKEEITANLEVCKGLEAERYVFSLIEPFKGFGEIIHKDRLAFTGRLCYEKRNLFCDWVCDISQDYELAAEAAVKLQEMAAAQGKQKKIVLSYVVGTLDRLLDVVSQYSNMLDGVLLSFGVDLLQVQKINGITLINQRDLAQLSFYCGTMERALILINRLGQEQAAEQHKLPVELNTDEAKKYIQKAVNIGVVEYTESGVKWNGTKQLLAYFAEKMSISLNLSNKLYNTGNKAVCWKPFEKMFGVCNLREAKQNWLRLNTRFEPTGFENINKIFD